MQARDAEDDSQAMFFPHVGHGRERQEQGGGCGGSDDLHQGGCVHQHGRDHPPALGVAVEAGVHVAEQHPAQLTHAVLQHPLDGGGSGRSEMLTQPHCEQQALHGQHA